ncbi:hypothetical protein [Campylobacter troglodytis]|uniref:hypothetical protein n=1 Tax=Campylobacter troglodytis TaxID=654363 RepID=UPI001157F5C5|nr:hypothetical protein [Campylobacter troglodytis]TQR60497.1 hypothetical protein DMC01_05390 [Campylobacter troglodytis]
MSLNLSELGFELIGSLLEASVFKEVVGEFEFIVLSEISWLKEGLVFKVLLTELKLSSFELKPCSSRLKFDLSGLTPPPPLFEGFFVYT